MEKERATYEDWKMAQVCVNCRVCEHARDEQKGASYWWVKAVDGGFCPYCKAFERVYGRKAHVRGVPNYGSQN
jgi:hypothetical protein